MKRIATVALVAASFYCSTASADQMAEYQAEYAEIGRAVAACQADLGNWQMRMNNAVMNNALTGSAVNVPQPSCADKLPQWTATAAFLEKQLYGTPMPTFPSTSPAPAAPSLGSACKDDFDGVIRGTHKVLDANGVCHEVYNDD